MSGDPQRGLVHTFLLVCLPFGAGYFLSYFYRSINAVISGPLAAEFGLSASDLGLLTSVYFFGFAAFQLPLGVLLDRFGPRWVQAHLLLVAAFGAVIFSVGTGLGWLIVGRTLIGIGVAGGLMASFKVITLWFPQQRWPRVNGIFMGIGGLGVVAATTPVQLAMDTFGWRPIFQALSFATIVAAVAIIYVAPVHGSERRTGSSSTSLLKNAAGLSLIFKDRLFWRMAPVTCIALGAGLAVQGLWAGPWLRDVAGLSPGDVAHQLLIMSIALTVGFVMTGPAAEVCARFGINKVGVVGLSSLGVAVVLSLLALEIMPQDYWVWVLFGLVSNIPVVAFPALSEHFGPEFAGRSNTALNLVLFSTAFAFQYFIGFVLNQWPTIEGRYHPEGYTTALWIIVSLVLVAFLWVLLPHEKTPSGGAVAHSA